MNLYERLFARLNEAGVKYMVVGGVAVNLYGIERATGDVDLLVDLEDQNLKRFIETANSLELVPRAPVELDRILEPETRRAWIKEKGMMAFSMYDRVNSWFQVDILINEPVSFSEVYDKREEMDIDGTTVPVAPVEALIAMKENTGRPQDEADAVHLRKVLSEWDDE
jgi:predicted nucleotidyltransferase